jgi:ribosomal protein S18 acetylase RimI-like enzyme
VTVDGLIIRPVAAGDRTDLRLAVVELHEHERRLHPSRLPGEKTAGAYLDWMLAQAAENGAVLIAEVEGAFAGFAAGWIAEENLIEETTDSNRFGLISDVCVLARFRGRRIALRLLDELEDRLARHRVRRIRLSALAANSAAHAAYERSGYAPYEIVYEKVVAADRRRGGGSAARQLGSH